MSLEFAAKKAMDETAKKAREAENAKKRMNIQKDILREMDKIKHNESMAAFDIKKGIDPVGNRVAIKQSADKIKAKKQELNRLS